MSRIGLTQRVTVVESYGERRDCLDQAWTGLLEAQGFEPVPLPNTVEEVGAYLDSFGLEGLVLTSGNDLSSLSDASDPAPERDRFEAAALSWAVDEQVPVLGVCRGLEFINDHLGGSLTVVDGHVATEHEVRFRETGLADLEWTGDENAGAWNEEFALPERVDVNSYHDYGIGDGDVAEELVVLGRAADGSVECVAHETYPLVAIMWHPERETPSSALDRQLFTWLLGDGDQ